MTEKKIPVTIRLKKDIIYLTYDEKIVENYKRFHNLFSNRILGIDLNPDYFGISIIEFDHKDNFKIIYKEVIDVFYNKRLLLWLMIIGLSGLDVYLNYHNIYTNFTVSKTILTMLILGYLKH